MAEKVTGKSKSKHVRKLESKAFKPRLVASIERRETKAQLADSLTVAELRSMLKKKSRKSKRSEASE